MPAARSTTAPKGRATPPRARQSKPAAPSITFKGETYRIADKVGIMPLMQLARAAEGGVMLGDMRGLAAAHAMLEDVIHPDDWHRFQEDMIVKKVGDLDELMKTVQDATELITTRMTRSNGRKPAVKAAIEDS